MIETLDIAIQLIFTAISAGFSAYRYVVTRDRAWLLLGFAAGVYFLGDVYWQFYLVFYGHTPHYSYIPSLAWYASYLFLLLLLVEVRGERKPRRRVKKILFLVPVFTAGMSLYYMNWGEYFDNLLIMAFMTPLLWNTMDCLIGIHRAESENPACKWLCILILIFCASEYCTWTFSLYWIGDTIRNPYFWFDAVLSLVFLLFPLTVDKAVRH